MSTATARLRAASTRREGGPLAGLGVLIGLIWRRERMGLAMWTAGIAVFTIAATAALPGIYQDPGDRAARAQLMLNPGARAMAGPGYGLDDYTFGAMLGNEYLPWVGVFAAVMSILTVVRNTRGEEDAGRAELIRSNRVGRHGQLAATLTVTTLANLAVGAVLAVGLGALGIESIDWGGSLLIGAGFASLGIVFAGVAAVTAQLSGTARGASGLAFVVFGAAFALRAAGDMASLGGSALSWVSPIAWTQQTRVFVDDRWWPLALALVFAVVLVAAALWLGTKRDLGAGLVNARPGRSTAPPGLSSPSGLAWRLQRGSLVWWAVIMFVFTYGYGGLAGEVESFVTGMTTVTEALAGMGDSILEGFLAVIITVFAVIVAVYAVTSVLRVRSEERSGLAEPVLATAVSRTSWLLSHVAMAIGGAALIMLLSGVGIGLGAAQALGDWSMLPALVGAAVAYVPGIALLVGIGVALFGLAPAATSVVWLVLAYAGVVGWFGTLLRFPGWALDLSPLGHTPLLPAEAMRWTPVLAVLALAVLLIVAGVVGFRRRDLRSPA